METKTYLIENLDCANCAAKIERKFSAHPQVAEAVITFATRQLRLTAPDPDALIPELEKLARTVEDGVKISEKEGHSGEQGSCSCGHCHEEHHHHHHASKGSELPWIFLGAGLFALGLILEGLNLRWWAFGVNLSAYGILGWKVLAAAGGNLIRGRVFDENFLMSLATIGAFCIGEHPEGVGVMLFYRVGEYFEHRAVERSRSQILAAADLRPETVNRLEGESIHTIPAGEAQVGDVLLVRPGDRIPLDGTVLRGESRIDTAPITGEPVPVAVGPGSSLVSGCVNTQGQLTMVVEKPLAESMVTRILSSVENAAASKPKIDRFITRFARVYTPIVVAAAGIIAIVPSLITNNWRDWVYTALSFLVMSCPCALVLSVPLAFFSGIGVGSREGILFKGGVAMEAMAKIKAVAMDKTGTITKGEFKVQEVAGHPDLLVLCASCEQRSTHPIAVSVTAEAREQGLNLKEPETIREIPGRGIQGKLDGMEILCGNKQLLEEAGVALPELPESYGTLVLVSRNGEYLGYLRIHDTVKEGAAQAVASLHKSGIATAMLTGDSPAAAQAVGREVGIQEIHARLLPDEKLAHLARIRREKGAVMFVGDGINDAPVLAGADVGAAMGSGADAAIEAADVVYMTSEVGAIGRSLAIARQTNRIAWQNVIFALGVKAVVMVLGLLGFASMWMAVFADSGVAMLCVVNAIRVLYSRRK